VKTSVYHLQINISDAKRSLPFYKDLLSYFEYKIIDESKEHIGATNGTTDFWIIQTESTHQERKFHRKTTGLNHIAFKVSSKEDVDKFIKEFLTKRKIKTLYNTPKHFPEYKEGYYGVFFEDPDRIKLEIVYVP
jgi:catechol 2,3-dioxygenase-like lactoylglutathione lyase family enzyme